MSHEFKNTIKPGVKYCVKCGCLSYKNIPAINISLKNLNVLYLDPLILKYRPISLKLNQYLIFHANYIAHRKIGLLKIYEVSNLFDLDKVIIFKAIGLMDKIFLNCQNESIIEYIEKISLICILLSFQFNNFFSETNIKEVGFRKNKNIPLINKINKFNNRIVDCYQYIKTEIKDLIYWQALCLKYLNFNLSEFTVYDYINLFFQLGIIFTNENIDIHNYYNNCIVLLEIIINNCKICNFNQFVIAQSILYLNISSDICFNPSIIKYIYGVDFSKKKYLFCIKEICEIISEFYNLHFNNFVVNNRIINRIKISNERPNNIENKNLSKIYKYN